MAEYSKERLFFLKFPKEFFDDYRIKSLLTENDGYAKLTVLLKMACEATSHGGYLRFSKEKPYTTAMLAGVIGEPKATVESALETLRDYGLVEMTESDSIFVPMVSEMTESVTLSAQKKRVQRETRGGR